MSGSSDKYPGLPLLPPSFARQEPPVAEVIEEKCIGCDRCPPLCFFDSLFMETRPAHPYGKVAVVVAAKCTGCGLCFEACPVDAFVWVPGPRHPGVEAGVP
jgi:Na+-translocating ferredoxin:NAD+ oxidoreductase subunit B